MKYFSKVAKAENGVNHNLTDYMLSDTKRLVSGIPTTLQIISGFPETERFARQTPTETSFCEITPATLLERPAEFIPRNFSSRIMARLWDSERNEDEVHLRDDYRIAWLAVLLASRPAPLSFDPGPWARAFRQILGQSPEKLIPFFMARDYAGQHFPSKFLPFRYTKFWREDFAHILRSLGLPEQTLVPEFIASAEKQRLAADRPTLPPKKPSIGTKGDSPSSSANAAADRKGVA